MRSIAAGWVLAATVLAGAPLCAQQQPATDADTTVYVTILARAAPGRLLEAIEAYRAVLVEARRDASMPGFLMRHSQGDHWDVMIVQPVGNGVLYSADEDWEERFGLDSLIAWRQELIAVGPPVETFAARMDSAGFYHVEMFVAQPGKRAELIRQRHMENDYLAGVGRPTNFVFRRIGGSEYDVYTLGMYRDIKHFAESADIPPELEQEAAIDAGFEAADRIGTYLRTLISYHRDTLAHRIALNEEAADEP